MPFASTICCGAGGGKWAILERSWTQASWMCGLDAFLSMMSKIHGSRVSTAAVGRVTRWGERR